MTRVTADSELSDECDAMVDMYQVSVLLSPLLQLQ